MKITFSPPDIKENDIQEVVHTLRSGWITSGPKTLEFEKELSEYNRTNQTVCVNSATAGLEMVLRLFGVGEGDEVITSAYTYTASASVIDHVGAKIVLCDVEKDSFFMDKEQLSTLINEKTKAIIPVDIGGVMCDYDALFNIIEEKKDLFKPKGELQEKLGRILILADGAHSLGAKYKGKFSGSVADFTIFSFHAVKNLTTAEGGAITWKDHSGFEDEDIKRSLKLLTLHGQTKDALTKSDLGAWEYDIEVLGYKNNMTDIAAALGLSQLKRYEETLKERAENLKAYMAGLQCEKLDFLVHDDGDARSSKHLFMVLLKDKNEAFRNNLIKEMGERGIATNVHYKPLPMFTAYRALGFDIKDFPNAYHQYERMISLPFHTLLSKEDIELIISTFWECYEKLEKENL